MKVRIQRQQAPDTPSYWESFDYDGSSEISVAALLDHLNYSDDIINDQGQRTRRIHWECSCLQGVCGACAMVINGRPALACETFVKALGDSIEIRPLQKFPVICDLVTDRSSIQDNLIRAHITIGEAGPPSAKEHDHQYAAAKCLKCGLCLEVCPNYTRGETFFGAAFANDCYLAASRGSAENRAEIRKAYGAHFARDCSKALSCMEVCPMKIPTIASMAKLNRGR